MFKNLKAHRRVIAGRNITLSAAAVYALTRAASYATMNPAELNEAQQIITVEGRILGLWAAVWLMTAVYCVVDMVNRHTRHGLAMIVGWTLAWGSSYLVVWAGSGFTAHSMLATAIGWLTPGMIVFGFLLKVTALQDMLKQPTPPDGADE